MKWVRVGWTGGACQGSDGRIEEHDWVLDEDGNPTDDPNHTHALLPFGDIKGSGFGMIVEEIKDRPL